MKINNNTFTDPRGIVVNTNEILQSHKVARMHGLDPSRRCEACGVYPSEDEGRYCVMCNTPGARSRAYHRRKVNKHMAEQRAFDLHEALSAAHLEGAKNFLRRVFGWGREQ